MKTLIPCLLVALAEFTWSYLTDWLNVAVVTKRPLLACLCSVGSMTLAYGILAYLSRRNWTIKGIISAIIGATLATYLVASR